MLLNKKRLNVCLDGTLHLSSGLFVVITAGMLGERPPGVWSCFRGHGFSTSFFEGLWLSLRRNLLWRIAACSFFAGYITAQWHSDYHSGIEER